jgi:hypothetical protein
MSLWQWKFLFTTQAIDCYFPFTARIVLQDEAKRRASQYGAELQAQIAERQARKRAEKTGTLGGLASTQCLQDTRGLPGHTHAPGIVAAPSSQDEWGNGVELRPSVEANQLAYTRQSSLSPTILAARPGIGDQAVGWHNLDLGSDQRLANAKAAYRCSPFICRCYTEEVMGTTRSIDQRV